MLQPTVHSEGLIKYWHCSPLNEGERRWRRDGDGWKKRRKDGRKGVGETVRYVKIVKRNGKRKQWTLIPEVQFCIEINLKHNLSHTHTHQIPILTICLLKEGKCVRWNTPVFFIYWWDLREFLCGKNTLEFILRDEWTFVGEVSWQWSVAPHRPLNWAISVHAAPVTAWMRYEPGLTLKCFSKLLLPAQSVCPPLTLPNPLPLSQLHLLLLSSPSRISLFNL